MIYAAGILILDKQGLALFVKRGPGSDMPGLWCVPGGRLEDGEDAQTAALREVKEEVGYKGVAKDLRPWTRRVSPRETTGAAPTPPPGESQATMASLVPPADDARFQSGQVAALGGEQVDFTTFILKDVEHFEPVLGPVGSPEHVAYAWAPVDQPPEPLHPGVNIALRRFTMHETDVAKAIAAGELTSPQHYDNITFVDIRITGTGMSFRQKFNEHVWRDPSLYLNQDFVDRCNGLPVILEHPASAVLNTKEYRKRNIGSIVVPYIKHDEVWGVARIMDASAAQMLCEDKLSTSPAVVWRDPDVNSKFEMENGSKFLIEGQPSLLDHIAICEHGVWDKGGPATGVTTTIVDDLTRGDDMKLARIHGESDEGYKLRCDEMDKLLEGARADASGGTELDKVLKGIDAVGKALDSTNQRLDAIEEEKKADKARKDAETEEEKEALEKAEKAKDARKRADAFQFSKRKDGEMPEAFKERHDAEERDCADAEIEAGEPEPVAMDKAKKRRKDAEEDEEKERKDRADSRVDSETVDKLLARIDELETRIPAQPSDDEYNTLLGIQARHDAVYTLFGRSAPRAMQGESALTYKRRLLDGIKEHTQYKDVNLDVIAVDSAAFGVIGDAILTQAAAVARSPASVPEGEMREVVTQKNGHTYTDFVGDPKTWLAGHQPTGQAIVGFGSTSAKK